MRILMISDVYYPRVNGVSTSIDTFREIFRHHGHSVMLIAPQYRLDQEPEADVIRIPAKPVPFDPEDRLMSWRHISRRGDTLPHAGFDLVHIQTPFVAHYFGVRLAKRLGIPCIETFHTHFEEYFYHYIPFVPKRTLRMLARMMTRRQGDKETVYGGGRLGGTLSGHGQGAGWLRYKASPPHHCHGNSPG